MGVGVVLDLLDQLARVQRLVEELLATGAHRPQPGLNGAVLAAHVEDRDGGLMALLDAFHGGNPGRCPATAEIHIDHDGFGLVARAFRIQLIRGCKGRCPEPEEFHLADDALGVVAVIEGEIDGCTQPGPGRFVFLLVRTAQGAVRELVHAALKVLPDLGVDGTTLGPDLKRRPDAVTGRFVIRHLESPGVFDQFLRGDHQVLTQAGRRFAGFQVLLPGFEDHPCLCCHAAGEVLAQLLLLGAGVCHD